MGNGGAAIHAWESEELHVLRHWQGSFLPSPPMSPVFPRGTHGSETCVPIVLDDLHNEWVEPNKSLNSRYILTDKAILISILRRCG